jgi:hypothetical protein
METFSMQLVVMQEQAFALHIITYFANIANDKHRKSTSPPTLLLGWLFPWGPFFGEHGGGRGSSFPRAFERRVKFFVIRGTFIEEFERHVETGNSLHRAPRWGTWRGFIYGDF